MRKGLGLAGALAVFALGCATPERYEFQRPKMGTTFRITLYTSAGPTHAADAAEAAFTEIDRLNAIFSDWDPGSEVSRLCRQPVGTPVPVSEELFRVLVAARALHAASGGAFDVTVGPYVRLWRRARRQGELPSPERLAEARESVGMEKLLLDEEFRTVTLAAPGMRIDLGGVAKGVTLEYVLQELWAQHVSSALVDGGGDVAASFAPPGRAGWRVALAPLGDETGGEWVELENESLASSGDTYQFIEIDGVRYSHIVDPRTGLGGTSRAAASVLFPWAGAADACASALCVMDAEAARALIEELRIDARLVRPDGPAPVWDSPGMRARLREL